MKHLKSRREHVENLSRGEGASRKKPWLKQRLEGGTCLTRGFQSRNRIEAKGGIKIREKREVKSGKTN